MRFLKSFYFVVMVLGAFTVRAQDGDSIDLLESVMPPEVAIDSLTEILEAPATVSDSFFVFDSITAANVAPVANRAVPDSVLRRLRADDAFWYANADFTKKEEALKPQKESGLRRLFEQEWFRNLLWAIIIGGFITVLVLFLVKSNIRLFHRAPAAVAKTDESVFDENIFSIDYKSEISKAVQKENYRLAVRLYFLETLKHLTDTNHIQYKDDLTNSDYLFQLRNTAYHAPFKNLTRHFEYTWYGQFGITPAIYTAIESDFTAFKKKHGHLKKLIPYAVGAVALLVLIALAVNTPAAKKRKLDERVTLRQRDKIPYGTYVAQHLLSKTFSKAHVAYSNDAPYDWEDINSDTSGQAVFLICKTFNPERYELETITDFVKAGNYVFIITPGLGWGTERYLGLNTAQTYTFYEDSLKLTLQQPLAATASYLYPGKKWDSYFTLYDTATAVPLGRNDEDKINFVQLQSGDGRLFVHLAPLAFTNYFLLHKSNVRYFENVVSLLPPSVHRIVWNDYYVSQQQKQESEPNVLSVLWQHKPFRWGLMNT